MANPRILISAAHKSSGKTTISIGLCAALRASGKSVQSFKKGPDYIDPIWLKHATGRPCYNLDFYTSDRDEILETLSLHSKTSDISVIEGNKGLFDGLDLDGSNSNAALAALTDTPVVLVIDARGMTRGIAPLILGYQAFDTNINIAGVILNKVGGSRHESKLVKVIEHYTDVQVIGAVHRSKDLHLPERHLGLKPSNEYESVAKTISRIGELVGSQVDMGRLVEIAQNASDPELTADAPGKPAQEKTLKMGIARDAAFNFYYQNDLDAFDAYGVELVDINTLNDNKLPVGLNALFIGGGFPETQMQELSANKSLMAAIHAAIERGMPVYAECGGLMYLSRSLRWKDGRVPLVGIIPADTIMHESPQGRGYVRMEKTADWPWVSTDDTPDAINAHEFHYSSLDKLEISEGFGFRVLRGTGIDGEYDGIVFKNLFACYTHQRNTRQNPWVKQFTDFIRAHPGPWT
ncbi:MAG TPA: cobyrinic acid a,c-diamide synthase [Gammaproteobacteria bacterium]|nr:cobyrinic acid a,c-diamide synthase [Gammaproteobacteria bacterium]